MALSAGHAALLLSRVPARPSPGQRWEPECGLLGCQTGNTPRAGAPAPRRWGCVELGWGTLPGGTPMEGCVAFPVPPAPSPQFTDAWANTRVLLSTFRFLLSSSTSLCFWGCCQLLYWNTLPQQFRGWFLVFGQNPHEEKVPRLPFSSEKQQQFLCKINFR